MNRITKALVSFPILLLFLGCTKAPETTASISATECPKEPATGLDPKGVKEVSLGTQVLSETGQLKAGQDLGYSFQAKAGQNFSFSTKEEICVWVYAPNNKLLSDGKLPLDGKYVVQVSTLKGSTSFGLDITLGSLSAASSGANSSSSSTTSGFTEQAALDLVNQWLEAKAKIFGPPFDVQLAGSVTTGKVYEDISKADGSVNWLRNNNAYYTYGQHKVSSAGNFSAADSSAKIDVSINQPLSFYKNNQLVKNESTSDTYQFVFQLENGSWKIADRQKK
jgi:ARC6-like, IMS domain